MDDIFTYGKGHSLFLPLRSPEINDDLGETDVDIKIIHDMIDLLKSCTVRILFCVPP